MTVKTRNRALACWSMTSVAFGCFDSVDASSSEVSGAIPVSFPAGSANAASVASDTQGCPRWPAEQLVPWVGPLRYGVNPKPCVVRKVAENGAVVVDRVAYDGSRVVRVISTPTGNETLFRYDGNTLVSAVEKSSSGAVLTSTSYRFADGEVALDVLKAGSPGGSIRTLLDGQGYPQRTERTGPGGDSVARSQYRYLGCRLSVRLDSELRDGVWQDSVTEYFYDSQSRLVAYGGVAGEVIQIGYECAD